MVTGQPEKPWRNKTPKPDPDRRLTIDPGNIGSVDKTGPGIEYVFDADRGMIDKIAPENDFSGLIVRLKGKGKEETESLMSAFGEALMEKVAQVGEQNKDRAWEMVETCAKQTGISFPHVIQVYAELFTLCSRPIDKWAVVESHPGKMRLHQYTCSYLKAQTDAGLNTEGLPCKALCLSAMGFVSRHRNIAAGVELTKQLPADSVCEFTFVPK
jgi:hypothetical protein